MRVAEWACILLAAAFFAADAQNATECADVLCCRTAECVVERSQIGSVNNECLDAIVELDPRSGPSTACFQCITQSFNFSNVEIDGDGRISLPDLIDQDKLKACCGFGCPEYWRQFFNVFDTCGNVFTGLEGGVGGFEGFTQIFSDFREIINMIEEECDVVKDWPYDPKCAPRREESADEGGMKVCSVDNDPHVSTFDGGRTTCNSTGTLTLLENDYFTITATADPVPVAQGATFRGASILKSVTFTYKHQECAPFPNNATSLTIDPAYLSNIPHHTIREPKLWTTVTIRKFTMAGGTEFLTVQIITPYHEGPGICNGCPNDVVEPSSFFRRRSLLQPSEQQARDTCVNAGLKKEAFIETCIFDIMTSGDDTFSSSANQTENEYETNVQVASQDNQEFSQEVSDSGPSSPDTDSPSPSPSPSPDGDAGALGHSFSAGVVFLFAILVAVAQLQAWDTMAPSCA